MATRLNIPPPVRLLKPPSHPPSHRPTPPSAARNMTGMTTQPSLGTELESGVPSNTTLQMTTSALQLPQFGQVQASALGQRYLGSFTSAGDSGSARPSASSQQPSFGDSGSDWHSRLQSLQSGLIAGGSGPEPGTAQGPKGHGRVGRTPSWSRASPLDRSRLAQTSEQLPRVAQPPDSHASTAEGPSARGYYVAPEGGSVHAGSMYGSTSNFASLPQVGRGKRLWSGVKPARGGAAARRVWGVIGQGGCAVGEGADRRLSS